MFNVLKLGGLAETDAVFTLFVTVALLGWHHFYVRRRPTLAWTIGHAAAAAAALTKGTQGIVYFVAASWGYSAWVAWRERQTGESRFFLTTGHVGGFACFLVPVGVWQLLFATRAGLGPSRRVWIDEASARFTIEQLGEAVGHWLSFPAEVLVGALPGAALLTAFLSPSVRRAARPFRDRLTFLALAVGLCFLPVWFAPTARSRYFVPLLPCLAVMTAIAVEALLGAGPAGAVVWRRWRTATAATIATVALTTLGWSYVSSAPDSPLKQSLVTALTIAACGAAAMSYLLRTKDRTGRRSAAGFAFAVSAFCALYYVLPVTNWMQRTGNDTRREMAECEAAVPLDSLVSFDYLHHRFAYFAGGPGRKPIPRLPWPTSAADVAPGVEYFCFSGHVHDGAALPFAWEQIAVVGCDRRRHDPPKEFVVVGRRITPAVAFDHASVSMHP
jgi:4-amino-4-deoxy-L-arabinose transferase-like glycosyltransferase